MFRAVLPLAPTNSYKIVNDVYVRCMIMLDRMFKVFERAVSIPLPSAKRLVI